MGVNGIAAPSLLVSLSAFAVAPACFGSFSPLWEWPGVCYSSARHTDKEMWTGSQDCVVVWNHACKLQRMELESSHRKMI